MIFLFTIILCIGGPAFLYGITGELDTTLSMCESGQATASSIAKGLFAIAIFAGIMLFAHASLSIDDAR